MLIPNFPIVSDLCASAFFGAFASSILKLFEETAKRGFFYQKLNRTLVHTSIGPDFMFCLQLFSSGYLGALVAALSSGINAVPLLLIGLGIWKNYAALKSMRRYRDFRLQL